MSIRSIIDEAYSGRNPDAIKLYRKSGSRAVAGAVAEKNKANHMSFNKVWEHYKTTEKFQSLKKSINQKEPYNENIIWWAFSAGWEAHQKAVY